MGAEVVQLVADRAGAELRRAPRLIRADVATIHPGGERGMIAIPRVFMNESGRAVVPLVRYHRVAGDRLLVVHDDIDLPFGKLRAQYGRGHGGHNGVRSVATMLGGTEFWRLKVGVGRPPGRMDPADYVLRRFGKDERPEIDVTIQYAADLVEEFITGSGEAVRERAGQLSGDGA